jgi:hypothetical protein
MQIRRERRNYWGVRRAHITRIGTCSLLSFQFREEGHLLIIFQIRTTHIRNHTKSEIEIEDHFRVTRWYGY